MADTLSSPGAHGYDAKTYGNFAVRELFTGKDFGGLVEIFHIDEGEVTWDVGVPMFGDRPVLDDSLIRDGKTEKQRIHLGVAATPDCNEVVVSLTNLRKHKDNKEQEKFKPPVIDGVGDGLFAPETQHDSFDGIAASLKVNGDLQIMGLEGDQEPTLLFAGSSMVNRDYERGVSLFRRMLRIPLIDGLPRRPID